MIQEIYVSYDIDSKYVISVCEDLDEHSLKIAKQYEGRGYKGAIIKQVLGVDSICGPTILQNCMQANAQVNMRIKCIVDIVIGNSILCDCQVDQWISGFISCERQKQTMLVRTTDRFDFKKGDKMVTILDDCYVAPYRQDSTFICSIYVPPQTVQYFVVSDVSSVDNHQIKQFVDIIQQSFDRLNKEEGLTFNTKKICEMFRVLSGMYNQGQINVLKDEDKIKQIKEEDVIRISDENLPLIQLIEDKSLIPEELLIRRSLSLVLLFCLERIQYLLDLIKQLKTADEKEIAKYKRYLDLIAVLD